MSPTCAAFSSLIPAMTKPTSAGGQELARRRARREHAHLLACEGRAVRHQQDLVARLQHAVHHADQHHHADVVVEPGIDDQRLQRRIGIPFGGGIRAMTASRMSSTPSPVLALARIASCAWMPMMSSISLDHAVRIRGRQVDLVQHRHDGDALLDRRVAIGDRLRLDPLRCVDDQQRAFAGRERARNLVSEIDVSRRVDQIELVDLAVCAPCRPARRSAP